MLGLIRGRWRCLPATLADPVSGIVSAVPVRRCWGQCCQDVGGGAVYAAAGGVHVEFAARRGLHADDLTAVHMIDATHAARLLERTIDPRTAAVLIEIRISEDRIAGWKQQRIIGLRRRFGPKGVFTIAWRPRTECWKSSSTTG